MRYFISPVFIFLIAAACAPSIQSHFDKTLNATEARFQDQTGLVIFDPVKNETLYSFNGDRYFTPASNTKIFTFYTCLRVLGDSLPGLRYRQNKDSLIFWGTGDPSLLYKYVYQNNKTFDFLKSCPQSLYFSNSNFNTSQFGRGWAWDDYNDYYSAERSPLPVYGNIFSMEINDAGAKLKPAFFKKHQTTGSRQYRPKIEREVGSNDFKFLPGRKKDTLDIPFKVDAQLITALLMDTLKRSVTLTNLPLRNASTLYSIPTDSVYKVMMLESDNFLAEQLLLTAAGVISDTLQPEIMIRYSKKNFLSDLQDAPVWVDGSGLSRYNLMTPRSFVQVWDKIYRLVPRERLFSLLPIGGKSGTIKNWYAGEHGPYVYAKTGTLSNNHCLSGYIVTKTGRTLIFSYMNSNYVVSTSEIRRQMQAVLEEIYETF